MPAPRPKDAPFQANLHVVGRFLDRLAEPGRAWTKASLQAACGVNYDIFRRYLALLEAKGYASVGAAGRVALTEAGHGMRRQLQVVLAEFLASPPGVNRKDGGEGTDAGNTPRRGAAPRARP